MTTANKAWPKGARSPADGKFEVLHEIVAAARARLDQGPWDYVMGGAETETTMIRNRLALDSLAFRPRVLNDVQNASARSTFLGIDLRLPVILAPIGSFEDIVEGGALVPSLAAAEFGALHMLSSVTKPSLEDVAASNPHPKLFQLYVRGDSAWIDDIVARVIAAGYRALAVTVDLDYYGRRERDLAKRYRPTSRLAAAPSREYQERFNWADIERIKAKHAIPLILKGIATAEDATEAVNRGVDVVHVSNHGGRQLDHGKGTVQILPEVVEAVRGRAAVVVDGGICRGSDIVKAMALGADAVAIGKMQALAAAAAGQAGIVRLLELLEDEVIRCLGLLGARRLCELSPRHLEPIAPLAHRQGLAAAFPLLDEGY
ncbi:MAG: alpha-hydroxy acid oxidase [Hyphomicrobiaceae bacterium]